MIEVELKAKVSTEKFCALQKEIIDNGFTLQNSLLEKDSYFNGVDRNFAKTDEALRIRTVWDSATSACSGMLTYKGPKLDAVSSSRKEIEIPLHEPLQGYSLLQALGYVEVFKVEKKRLSFIKENITICLDDVNELGTFIELEILLEETENQDFAVETLLLLLDSFSIPRTCLTRLSYLEMLLQ